MELILQNWQKSIPSVLPAGGGETWVNFLRDKWSRNLIKSFLTKISGKFTVLSDNPRSKQAFNWEVKAVRKDVPELQVEVDKSSVEVLGDGPYTYLGRKR